MASRALTAMLISAVSNWPASALMKHGSSGTCVTISIGEPVRVPIISLRGFAEASVFEYCRLWRLPTREFEQLGGQLGGAAHGIRNRVDVTLASLLGEMRPPQ